jgi:hypothetical protein
VALVIGMDYEVRHPRVLYVFRTRELAVEHAQAFCESQGLIYNSTRATAKQFVDGRSFEWWWAWPVCDRKWPWVYDFAGIEISTVHIDAPIASTDLLYLVTRIRGAPYVLGT